MPMRLQEVHPAVVHFPITIFPIALGTDALGRVTGEPALLRVGKWGIALAVGSATLAALTGLIAQEEVRTEEDSMDLLVTHRNLNVGFLALTATMAVRRTGMRRPSLWYLTAGLAGLAAVTYSAYLGGRMVYEYGTGVEAARGIRQGHGPALVRARAREVARHAVEDVRQGAIHAVQDLAGGQFLPALTRGAEPRASQHQA